MSPRKKSHSEERWALLPKHIIRCHGTLPSGKPCRREAEPGSVVCENHGGAAGQVRRRAAERILISAEDAMEVIKSFLHDPTVPHGVRLKAAQDLADRAGLAAAQIVKVMPAEEDPISALFNKLLSSADALEESTPEEPPQLESPHLDDVIEAEIVEDDEPPKDGFETFSPRPPTHIAEGIRRIH